MPAVSLRRWPNLQLSHGGWQQQHTAVSTVRGSSQQQQRSRQPLAVVGQPGGATKPLDRARTRDQGVRDACCRCPGLWRRAWSHSVAMRWPRAHAGSATNARDQIQRHWRSNARRVAWPRAAVCRWLRRRPCTFPDTLGAGPTAGGSGAPLRARRGSVARRGAAAGQNQDYLRGTLIPDQLHLIYHPLRLRLDRFWSGGAEGLSPVFVCARATLHCWVGLEPQQVAGV